MSEERDSHDEWREMNVPFVVGSFLSPQDVPVLLAPTWTPHQIAKFQTEMDRLLKYGNNRCQVRFVNVTNFGGFPKMPKGEMPL